MEAVFSGIHLMHNRSKIEHKKPPYRDNEGIDQKRENSLLNLAGLRRVPRALRSIIGPQSKLCVRALGRYFVFRGPTNPERMKIIHHSVLATVD